MSPKAEGTELGVPLTARPPDRTLNLEPPRATLNRHEPRFCPLASPADLAEEFGRKPESRITGPLRAIAECRWRADISHSGSARYFVLRPGFRPNVQGQYSAGTVRCFRIRSLFRPDSGRALC